MPFALSLVSILGIAATLAVLLGGGAYLYAQARRRAAAEAEREAHAAHQRDTELRYIRQRLEEIYERQQTGAETQFARVNQELEDLHASLDAKGRQIDGVQGQLRYELKRQEEEIALLRNQLREAIEVFAAAALPAARPAAPALPAPPDAARPAPAEVPAEPEVIKDDAELLDDLFGNSALDAEPEPDHEPEPDDQPIPVAENAPETERAEGERGFTARPLVGTPGRMETSDDFEFVEVARPSSPRPTAPRTAPIPWNRLDEIPTEALDDPEALDEPEPRRAAHGGDGMNDAPPADAFATPAPALRRALVVEEDRTGPLAEEDADAAPAPSNEHLDPSELVPLAAPEAVPGTEMVAYDDLTVLSAVDAPMQQKLYALGITTVEAIARWSRADARRIASQLTQTSEEDIMDRWVFEAQAVLFDRYQEELRTRRQQRLTG